MTTGEKYYLGIFIVLMIWLIVAGIILTIWQNNRPAVFINRIEGDTIWIATRNLPLTENTTFYLNTDDLQKGKVLQLMVTK